MIKGTPPITQRDVLSTWWPLAGSWLLMGLELPFVGAIMARLPLPEVSLAAYGGIVFPLALIIEAPVIMFLAASTALSRDYSSYMLMRRVMHITGAVLTLLHAAIAFTPLFDVVVVGIMNAPEPIHDASRLGLMIMTPWTWAIGYRRFQQGVLIRYGHSRVVIVGTATRLATNLIVLATGYLLGWQGIITGTLAVALGVMVEATMVGIWVQPVIRNKLKDLEPEDGKGLEIGAFAKFYTPLALTSLITLMGQPMASAAIARMPLAVSSMAVIPVLNGLTFMLRSLGFSYNEVVVALLDKPGAYKELRRFAAILACCVSGLMLLVAATPLGLVYFGKLSGLEDHLVDLARQVVWISVLLPGLSAVLHFLQGVMVHARQTVAITESVIANVGTMVLLLWLGVLHGGITGLFVGVAAHVSGNIAQTAWLAYRSRTVRRRHVETSHVAEPELGIDPV